MRKALFFLALCSFCEHTLLAQCGPNGHLGSIGNGQKSCIYTGGSGISACSTTPPTTGTAGQTCYDTAGALWVCHPTGACTTAGNWVAVGGSGATIASTTSLLKGDNAGNGVAATPGTDYTLPTTPGTTGTTPGWTAGGVLEIPMANTALVTAGLLSNTDYAAFAGKAASNASTTVNGQSCALGSTCTVTVPVTYPIRGVTQAGFNSWNWNYQTLTNGAYLATDSAHLQSVLEVTANTTLLGNTPTNALGPWTITPIILTNPTVTFTVIARAATSAADNGSMALSYACIPAGTAVNSPTPVGLSALTLTTPATTSSVFQSSQTITCAATSAAPAELWVWWTPTAMSGEALDLLQLMLSY